VAQSKNSDSEIEGLFRSAIRAIDPSTDEQSLSFVLSGALSGGSCFDAVFASINSRQSPRKHWSSFSNRFPKGTLSQRAALRKLLFKPLKFPLILSPSPETYSAYPLLSEYLEQQNLAWIGIFPVHSVSVSHKRIGSLALLRTRSIPEEELFVSAIQKGIFELSLALSVLESEKRYKNLMNFYSALHEINHLIARRPEPAFLYDEVCRIAVLYGSLDLAWIALTDQKTGHVRIRTAFGPAREYADDLFFTTDRNHPFGKGPTGQSLREGRVILTSIDSDPNFEPWRKRAHRFNLHSSASLPFRRSGHTEGLMGVYSSDPHYFSPQVIALLSRLAEDIEFSLSTYDQARHIEKLQGNLGALLEITEEIAHHPDPTQLFHQVTGMIVDRLGAAFAATVEIRDDGRLALSAYAGVPLDMEGAIPGSIDMGQPEGFGIVARTFRMSRTLIVDNFSTDPSFLPWRQKLQEFLITSGAGFPLKVDAEVVGVLVIGSREHGFFSDDIADLFEGMAENLSFAIKDSRRKRQLEYLSLYDELTTLPNRSSFRESLTRFFQEARMEGSVFSVGIIDIDNFKEINDSLGHISGDLILREIGARFRSIVGSEHILCRIGGDEFGVILKDRTEPEDLLRFWNSLATVLKTPISISGYENGSFYLTSSAGFSVYSGGVSSPDDLLRQADQALYSAKGSGRNTWGLFTPELNDKIERAFRVRREFRKGLDSNQMSLFVQPQINLRTGLYIGSEALIRWHDPDSREIRLPGAFLPVIEEDPTLVTYLGQWVLEEAYQLLGQAGMENDHLSINIGALHFLHADFLSHVDKFHKAHPEISRRITIEITEAVALSHLDISARQIRELGNRGIAVSLDDFGTGFGSLSYLNSLPVNEIKIDQSFIRNMTTRPNDFAIVSGTMLTAAIRKITVVAEGLENLSTGVDLLRIGCHCAQGYGIARPMPATDLGQWKATWKSPALWKKGVHSQFLYRGIDLLAAQIEVKAMINLAKTFMDPMSAGKTLINSWMNLESWTLEGHHRFGRYKNFGEISKKTARLAQYFVSHAPSFPLLEILEEIDRNFSELIDAVEAGSDA
jgi:diguanylate cyclase (GGDEF)-like protein